MCLRHFTWQACKYLKDNQDRQIVLPLQENDAYHDIAVFTPGQFWLIVWELDIYDRRRIGDVRKVSLKEIWGRIDLEVQTLAEKIEEWENVRIKIDRLAGV